MKREIIRVEPLSTYLERSLILKITGSRLGDAGASLGPHLDNELSSHLGYINDKLERRNYLLGDELTAADIQLSFFGELASARTGIASYPNIGAWVKRFQALAPTRALSNGAALTALLNCHFATYRTLTFVNERSMPQIRDNNRRDLSANDLTGRLTQLRWGRRGSMKLERNWHMHMENPARLTPATASRLHS